MLTAKDYKRIAEAIADCTIIIDNQEVVAKKQLVNRLANYFKSERKGFITGFFVEMCKFLRG
jgi:hypothetical protein